LIIAHRLSTIRKCDKIIVIDKGMVSEIGTHDELLTTKGVYHKLWNSQIGEDVIVDDKDEGLKSKTDNSKAKIKEEEEIEYK
jgi:ABC-type multidrug transport system ATPase subunit